MSTHASLVLLAALGVLSSPLSAQTAQSAQRPDTSQWKCETCPYPKGITGRVDAGLGVVSDDEPRFGDYTGLNRDGAHLLLGGALTVRGNGGYYADVAAGGGDRFTRTLGARAGREGVYQLDLNYLDIPRHLSEGASTPFLGVGSDRLTLPAGFPAVTTDAMPLATTLRPVDLGYSYKRVDFGGRASVAPGLSIAVSLRRDTRDGTRGLGASFFSNAAQVPAPVDQVTDQLEVAANYATRQWQARLAWQLSEFKNDTPSLTWDNPFVQGAAVGRLALAPDNRMQQIVGSAGWQFSPAIRFSGDFAVGRLTQDEPFLAATINSSLTVPAPPRTSLDGHVDTFSGNLRATAQTPIEGLRVSASYAHDLRDDETDKSTWPSVSTDMFVGLSPDRTTTPFRHVRDRAKLIADWRGPDSIKLSGGVEHEVHSRAFSEVVKSNETSVWVRGGWQVHENVALSAKWLHAERDHSTYGTAIWFGAPENPLLRKYNLAERSRDSGGVRVDLTPADNLAIGIGVDASDDRYDGSAVGLKSARSLALSGDVSYVVSDNTRFSVFAHSEQVRSRQAGSTSFAVPDWNASSKDRFELLGASVSHAAIPDKLDLGAEVSATRARSNLRVSTGVGEDPFPTAKTALDTIRLFAAYKLNDQMTILGSVLSERQAADDWRLDGVLPDSVGNLLTFGQQAPHYQVYVLRLALRYRF
jgi:MtrB/PioB family decaheme-associated outer membrane protein